MLCSARSMATARFRTEKSMQFHGKAIQSSERLPRFDDRQLEDGQCVVPLYHSRRFQNLVSGTCHTKQLRAQHVNAARGSILRASIGTRTSSWQRGQRKVCLSVEPSAQTAQPPESPVQNHCRVRCKEESAKASKPEVRTTLLLRNDIQESALCPGLVHLFLGAVWWLHARSHWWQRFLGQTKTAHSSVL